jgi:hypothetical protein
MWTPFIFPIVLTVVFGLYLYICEREAKTGVRLFLPSVRSRLDDMMVGFFGKIERGVRYVIKYVITLSWYYSLHAFLQVTLRSIAGVYHVVEAVLIRNRDRARALRKERRTAASSHLSQIADHQAKTKLTPAEERKRKEKALKGL